MVAGGALPHCHVSAPVAHGREEKARAGVLGEAVVESDMGRVYRVCCRCPDLEAGLSLFPCPCRAHADIAVPNGCLVGVVKPQADGRGVVEAVHRDALEEPLGHELGVYSSEG